jgi:hypothetical protein
MTAAMLDFPERGGPFNTTTHPGGTCSRSSAMKFRITALGVARPAFPPQDDTADAAIEAGTGCGPQSAVSPGPICISFRAMAVRQSRPGSLDINPDVVRFLPERYRGYPGRPWYPPVYRVNDLVDLLILEREDLRPAGDLGLFDPGQLDNATGGRPGSRPAMTMRRAMV